MTMTAAEIILTIFLVVSCVIGGILLYRLQHVTALNIDLRRINSELRDQLDNIEELVRREFQKVYNKQSESDDE